MQILKISFYVLVAFIGYVVGRISHIFGGNIKSPHHWIYGAILIILGLIFYKKPLGKSALYFGLGLFISDFSDFLHLRLYGIDENIKKKFWGID